MQALLLWVPSDLWQATTDPFLCQRLLNTHGQVWISLLWSCCSFLLGPRLYKVLFVPSKSLFPQSCLCSGGSKMGLMATSSKRVYAIPRSVAPRAPDPVAVHCWHVPPQETLKHSSGSASVGSLGPGAHKVCLSPPSVSGGYGKWSRSVVSGSLWPHGLYLARLLHPWDSSCKNTELGCHFLLQGIFLTQGSNPGLLYCRQNLYHLSHQRQVLVSILNVISSLLPSCWGSCFAIGRGESFFGVIQHSLVDSCSAASCNFGVLTEEDECTSFYSAIFLWHLPPFTV